MKNFIEKYNVNYFVGFIIMCLIAVWLVYEFLVSPRPYEILWLLSAAITARTLYKCSKKGERPNVYEYNKTVKDWKRRKKAAQKAGEAFEENLPPMPEKTASYMIIYILGFLISFFVIVWVSFPLCMMFPYHAPYEYKRERPNTYTAENFFPEDIPDNAKNVKWIVTPSFLQARGHYILEFKTDRGYISDIVSKYGKNAANVESYNKTFLGTDFSKNARLYSMYDSDNWNHPWYEGFVVDEEKNKIAFFAGAF